MPAPAAGAAARGAAGSGAARAGGAGAGSRAAVRSQDAAYAFELGRSGEPMPDWVRANARFREAYVDGVPTRTRSGAAAARPADAPDTAGGAGRHPSSSSSTRSTKVASGGGGGGGGGGVVRDFVGTPTLRPPRHLSADDGSGFLLGLLLFAIGTSYWRYGIPGVKGWFSAKFLNQVDPAIAKAEAARGIAPKPRPVPPAQLQPGRP